MLKFFNTFINDKERARHHFLQYLLMVFICLSLTGCLSGLWTGASFIYDRHDFYKKINDYDLTSMAQHALFCDKQLESSGGDVDVTVFNGDILLLGHVPTVTLRTLAEKRLNKLSGYRTIYNAIVVGKGASNPIMDSWITTKIRGQIVANAAISPHGFKIVTMDSIVYIMGDVSPEQAKLLIDSVRYTSGVKRIVTLLRDYHNEKSPSVFD